MIVKKLILSDKDRKRQVEFTASRGCVSIKSLGDSQELTLSPAEAIELMHLITDVVNQ